MGGTKSKLPPFAEEDHDLLLTYSLESKHFRKLWTIFGENDVDCNGFWTVNEVFRLLREPRISMRAPIIDMLFFFADGKSDGCLTFQDFMVSFMSFCALSKEEVLQLFFMIVDENRDGTLDKSELNKFFSYVPPEAQEPVPMFPVNNKNALDKFRGGKWEALEFDGLAQLCEKFPYISYAVNHTQHLMRTKLLGLAFWDKVDKIRSKINIQERIFHVRAADGTWKQLERPGKCTMKEILEYSRRKTTVQSGKRVAKPAKAQTFVTSEITKLRDEQIARMPLMNLIRNCRCMYYVPKKPPIDLRESALEEDDPMKGRHDQRPELEMEGFNESRPMSADIPVDDLGALLNQGQEDDDEWETDTDPSENGDVPTSLPAIGN